jgi:glycosyltransferase involved in cell wall biosynthesis
VAPATLADLVSIVIPCFRGERFLAKAVESCLGQRYPHIEILIVDDASPDSCALIAEKYALADTRVRVVRRPCNGGVSRAFNSGFEIARGKYFTRLAQDDVFEPDAVATLVACLEAAPPGTGLAYCNYCRIDEAGKIIGDITTAGPRNALRYRNEIGLCVMWTRDVWKAIGGFNPEFDAAEDFEYWLRVAERFSMVKCEGRPALRVRMHGNMGTVQFAEKQRAAYHRALVARAREGRFKFDRRWAERQIAVARVHQTWGDSSGDRKSYGKALAYTLLSLAEWPLPFPDYARIGKPTCSRARMLVSYSTRMLRSVPGLIADAVWALCRRMA